LDKDCELQKIAAFESHLEAHINAQYTFLAGGLIGILLLVLTLLIEGFFDVVGGRFLGLVTFAIILVGVFCVFGLILHSIKEQQTKHLSLIFDLISKVEQGETIPSLHELEKKVDQKNKPKSLQRHTT
jgi:hypothetical protein